MSKPSNPNYNTEYYRNNRDKLNQLRKTPAYKLRIKEATLRRKYGIGLSDYQRMFTKQAGCCHICKQHQSAFPYDLCVEHRHSDGKIRGLTCRRCNTILAMLNDDPNMALSCHQYLTKD